MQVPARLVAGDDPLVRLRSGAQVFPVDGAQVAAADRRCRHPQQDLPGPGSGTSTRTCCTVLLPGNRTPLIADIALLAS
jgi:hypothetical protein